MEINNENSQLLEKNQNFCCLYAEYSVHSINKRIVLIFYHILVAKSIFKYIVNTNDF
mgnify:CR=1 FL=1